MKNKSKLRDLGFSQYEAACYMALLGNHPANGSQLSKISGIARSRIYDVLRNLSAKGFVIEVNTGQYAPLPVDELVRRLRRDFESNIQAFEAEIARADRKNDLEFIWTLTGYDNVMEKARHMIQGAEKEIYARLFPEADRHLSKDLIKAQKKAWPSVTSPWAISRNGFRFRSPTRTIRTSSRPSGAAPLTLSLIKMKLWWAFLKWTTKTAPHQLDPEPLVCHCQPRQSQT